MTSVAVAMPAPEAEPVRRQDEVLHEPRLGFVLDQRAVLGRRTNTPLTVLSGLREFQSCIKNAAIKYPTSVAVPTPISPGIMKLWFRRYLPMWVVPVRSKLMADRSLG